MATTMLDPAAGDVYADITSHDTYLDGFPHAAFRRLRREEPVTWTTESDGSGFWSVTGHADVIEVSRFEVRAPDLLRSNFIRGIKHVPVKVG